MTIRTMVELSVAEFSPDGVRWHASNREGGRAVQVGQGRPKRKTLKSTSI